MQFADDRLKQKGRRRHHHQFIDRSLSILEEKMRLIVVVVSRRSFVLLVVGGAPFLCSLLRLSLATVVLNSISASFPDLPAKFDGSVTKNGICGALYVADPLNGCSPLLHADASNNLTQQQRTRTRTNFALIIRGECSFEDKLLNAHKSGFRAVIVYDNFDNQDLVVMKVNPQDITVVAVFVSNVAGEVLSKYARGRDGECCLYPPTKGSAWTVLAISFFSLLLILTFLLLAFFAPRHWTLWRRGTHNRTIRVDANLVHSLPSFTFTTDSSSPQSRGYLSNLSRGLYLWRNPQTSPLPTCFSLELHRLLVDKMGYILPSMQA